MGKKSNTPKEEIVDGGIINVSGNVPKGATQEDINPRVEKEPKTTFEQRTAPTQPWLNKEGEQVNQ